jgi:hypothetical protein
MVFLSKDERVLINKINSSQGVSENVKKELVKQISDVARLRQDGNRFTVREFFSALSAYHSRQIIKNL